MGFVQKFYHVTMVVEQPNGFDPSIDDVCDVIIYHSIHGPHLIFYGGCPPLSLSEIEQIVDKLSSGELGFEIKENKKEEFNNEFNPQLNLF